ncbi:Aldolase-type TIM barrel [Phytophthora cactorum]|nr:Aldolase-type TIM barrel [Phytophthora cactorum]
MAGAQASDLAIAVARGGGLGAIPCALLSPDAVREHVQLFRAATKDLSSSINLNFFCHTLPPVNPMADKQWQDILTPYYREYGVDLAHLTTNGALRMPFDEGVKDAGAFVISSATTVREALWLEEQGCDAVIAQGLEAGGHRGFSCAEKNSSMDFPRQTGTMSLVPQIVDAVKIPVIAAGGIGDAPVQMGTVFLLADETKTSALHRKMLKRAASATGEEALETAITTIFSGRPARGFVTLPDCWSTTWALKQAAEANGDTAFSSLWSGQSPGFAQEKSAEIIVRSIVEELEVLEADNANGTLSSLNYDCDFCFCASNDTFGTPKGYEIVCNFDSISFLSRNGTVVISIWSFVFHQSEICLGFF